jgi:hypothetical protein
MTRHLWVIVALVLSAVPARADPGFVENLGTESAWPDGPEGTFNPEGLPDHYMVWVDGVNGLDQNPGTEGSPVKTIARAFELIGGGGTVVVLAGTYNEQVKPPDLIPASSRRNPVVLLADPPDGQSVVIDGTGVVPVAEGTLQTAAGVSLYRDGGFVVIGFLIQNWSGYGLAVQQSSDAGVRGCTFRDNGAGMNDSVDLLVISSRDVKVFHNTFDSATERAIDDRSTDTWILGNDFSGHTQNAVKIGPHPEGQGCRLEHNRFFDNPATQGVVRVHDAKGVTVQRNLLVRGSLQGIRLDALDDTRVLLNTVVGFQTGIEISSLQGCRIEGNILTDNTMGVLILLATASLGLDGNLYFNNTVDVDSGDPGPNALFQDPGYENPTSDDYSLGGGSQSIDAGPADLPVPQGGGSRVDLGYVERGAGAFTWDYQPVGTVADFTPRFFWEYVNRDAVAQGSYRVQVDTWPTFDSQDLIDSNWQESADEGWTVPYGFELAAGDWYVRVKVQDVDHTPSPWSDPHIRFSVVTPDTCQAQGGEVCAALDTCDGQWLVASDQHRCCLGSCIPCADADSDNHPDEACGGDDCDDSDPAINPDAEEVCDDSVDNDCDGFTDLEDDECGCVDHDCDGYGENCELGDDCDDTIASVHPGAEELCNNTDDDCDGQTDEGFDLLSDPDNCGECGWVCRDFIPEVCDLGECKTECTGGRSDCDRACIDTSSDLNNCGACGAVCDVPNASEKCTDGVCTLTACDAGWVDLNGETDDGCEYQCTPSASGEEECGNGTDDNCDGEIDEGCEEEGCSCGRRDADQSIWLALLACALIIRRRGGPAF